MVCQSTCERGERARGKGREVPADQKRAQSGRATHLSCWQPAVGHLGGQNVVLLQRERHTQW